jgi:hypothetical protein
VLVGKLLVVVSPTQDVVPLSVMELPGIEPGPKIDLNWDDSGIDHAKVRETTCGYADVVDGIMLMASTPSTS